MIEAGWNAGCPGWRGGGSLEEGRQVSADTRAGFNKYGKIGSRGCPASRWPTATGNSNAKRPEPKLGAFTCGLALPSEKR